MPDYTAMKQQHRLQELEADNKHFEVQNKVLQARLEAAFKERDEALFDLAFRRDLFALQESQLNWMRDQLAKQLTLLQENGLAEYGN